MILINVASSFYYINFQKIILEIWGNKNQNQKVFINNKVLSLAFLSIKINYIYALNVI